MNFISACILVNAIMLSIEHYDMSPGLSSALTDANLVITIVFVAETVLKLVAFGLQCAKDGFNVFDFFIAAISLVEVTVMGRASQLSLLRVMRLFRVLRVLKLARRWHVLQRVVDVIAAALSYIGYLLLLIALFIFIFAVLGRAILAGKLRRPEWCHTRSEANCTVSMPVSDQCEWRPPLHDPNCTQPDSLCCRVGKDWGSYDNTGRAHFDGLLWAALHVFQILTKDNWALLCFRVMREVGGVYVSFFTVILILGTYLLFSMFIAILLVKLGDDGEQREELEKRLGIEGEGQDSPASPASPASASPSFAGAAGGGVSNSSTLVPIDKANLANVTSADSIPAATSTIPRCDSPGPAASPTSESPRAAATDASPRGRKLQVTRTEAKLEMMKMAIERKEEMKDAKRKNYRARRESVVSQSGRKPSRSFMLGSSFTPLTATSKYASAADQLTTGDEAESASIYSGKSLTTTGKGRTLVSALKGTRRASQTETDLEEATRKGEKRAKMAECPVVVTAEPSETSPHAGKQLELDELLKEAKVLDADEKLLNFAEDDERSDDAEWEELEGRSCFIFGPDNALRIWLTDMLLGRWFEYFISYAIIGNCMLITLNANLLQSQRAATIVRYVDWGFTGLFTIEMIVRCIVNGAFIEAKAKGPGERKTTYLRRHKWNVVDAAIVGLSLVAIPFELEYSQDGETPTHISTVTRMIKAARAFRPLRILVRTKRMKVVIGAFVNTIPAVFNVLAVAFVLYFVFGIAGTQLLSGAYRRCSDGSDRNRTECESTIWNATRFDGVYLSNKTRPGQNESDAMRGWRAVQSEWINPLACSFDNLLLSWMTLLEVASLSGWVDIMYEAADSPTATDGPPVRNNSLWATVFFVLWIFAGAYCVMNIFTGVVVDHFTRKKLELSGYGSIFLTMEQEQSLRVKRILSNAKAKKRRVLDRNATLLNKCCYIVVCNPLFPKIILLCILANMGLMATIYHGMSEDHIKIQTTGNLVFTVIFTIEMFLEIGIAGVRAYLRFRWCRLDCAIVLISWAEFITGLIVDAESSASVVQILRLGRGIRVLKHFKGLRDLLMTLYYSLPAFYNISSLLLLMFFMYGVLGTALFEDVRVTDSEELYPIMLSQVANFRNFPRSVLTLYRVATMDSWIRIIKGCQLDEPYCSKEEDNCGDTVAAFVYFTTFQLIVGFVMMNLFIAVVLENFRESVLLPEDLMRKMDQITLFRDVWSRYDPQGRQYIDAIQFVPLMKELPRPIGLADCPQRVILPSLQQLDFPVTFPDQRVLFVDAIDAVGEVVFDIKLVDSLATRKYLRVVGNLDIYLHGWTIAHFYSACVIQTAFRNYCTGQPITGGYLYEAPSTDANLRAAHRELRKERRQNEERLLEESRRRPSLMKHGHPGESTLGVPRPSRRPSQERREQDGLASSVRIRSGVTMVRVASLAASGRRRPSEPTEVTDAVLPKLRHDQAKDIAKDLGKDEEVDDLGEYNLEGHMQRAMSVSARPGTRRRGSTTLSNPPQSDPPRSPQAAMSRVGSRFGRAARAKPAGVYGVQRPAEEDDSLTRRDSGGPQPIQGRMLSLRSDRSGSLRQLRKQLQKPSGSGEATKAADISSIRVRPVQPPTPPAAPSGQEMMEGVEVVSECGSDLSWSARPRRTSPARSPASSPPATTFNPLAGGRRGAPQLLGAAPRAALGPGAEYRLRLAAPAAACAGALATAAAAAAGRTRQRQETMPQAFQLSLLSRSQNKNRPAVIDLLTANGLGSLHGIPEVYSVNVGSKPSKSIMSDPLASPAGAPAPGPLSVSALRPPGQQQQQQTSRVALGPTTSLRSPAQLAPSPASAVSLGPALAAAAGSRGSGKPPQQALLTPARDSTAELWPPPRRPSPGPGESALRAALGPRGVATSAPAPAPAAPPAPSSCVAPPEAPTAPEPLSALSPGSVPISSPQWASPSHPPKRRPGPHGVRVAEPQRVAAPRRGKRRAQQQQQQQQQQQPAASAVDARELLLQAQQHLRKMRGGVATFDALPKQQQQHQHQQQQQQQLPALQPAAQRPEAPSPASPPASAPAALPGVLPGLSPLLPAGTPAVASPVGPALWGSPTVLL